MEIKLPYGRETRAIRIPQQAHVEFLSPPNLTPIEDVAGRLASVCSEPIGTAPLADRVEAGRRVLILVSDLTRSQATESMLPLLVEYLRSLGAESANIRVLVARGTHRKLNKAEREALKKPALAGVAIEEHDADNLDRMSALLLTSRGTPVRINNAVREADVVVVLSSISFHYFAGFGGGRKLILPGCADRNAILANHRLSLTDEQPATLHPRCRPAVLEGNPVHEDMLETVAALDKLFVVNFFCDPVGELVYLNAGDIERAHVEACDAYRDVFEVRMKKRYGVLVLSAGGWPYDINLLQSHKALRHGSYAVRESGTILYFAECEEGIGSSSLEAALSQPKKEFLRAARERYDLNNQTAVSLHALTEHCDIGMVSAVNVDSLLSCGVRSVVNPESYLADALERAGSDEVAVMSHGHAVLPRVEGEG